jgi:hypothetical protein
MDMKTGCHSHASTLLTPISKCKARFDLVRPSKNVNCWSVARFDLMRPSKNAVCWSVEGASTNTRN